MKFVRQLAPYLFALPVILAPAPTMAQSCAESCTPGTLTFSCTGMCRGSSYPYQQTCTGQGVFSVFDETVCLECEASTLPIDVEEDDGCPGGQGDACASGTNSTAPCLPGLTCQNGYCESGGAAPGCGVPGANCETVTCCAGLQCNAANECEPPALPTCGPAGNPCSNCIPPSCPDPQAWNPELCECYQYGSPIVIDTDGSGFHLTSAASGVLFDFFGNGKPVQIAWTAQGSTNGWLALDREGDGEISSAKDLFGNITAQPPSDSPNGFLALAVFDEPANGGNGDGIIDNRDAVWPKLLVWIDANHDGISQPEELHHLDDVGIHSIGLMYTESLHVDAYGNQFRYKGHLNPDKGDNVNRVIYDVILTYEE
jgi:hypothetical protein